RIWKTERDCRDRAGKIFGGEDRPHSRHSASLVAIDRPEMTMRDGAANENSGELPVAANVRDILAPPLQEAKILDPANGAADEGIRAATGGMRLRAICLIELGI